MKPDDALVLLRESQDRVLDREGIPMILALVDETINTRMEDDETLRPTGEGLAILMDDLAQALAPTGRDGDLGRVINVLTAAAYLDFGQGRTLL